MAQMDVDNIDNDEPSVNNQEERPVVRKKRGPYNKLTPSVKYDVARVAAATNVNDAIKAFSNLNLSPSTVSGFASKWRRFEEKYRMFLCIILIPFTICYLFRLYVLHQTNFKVRYMYILTD